MNEFTCSKVTTTTAFTTNYFYLLVSLYVDHCALHHVFFLSADGARSDALHHRALFVVLYIA